MTVGALCARIIAASCSMAQASRTPSSLRVMTPRGKSSQNKENVPSQTALTPRADADTEGAAAAKPVLPKQLSFFMEPREKIVHELIESEEAFLQTINQRLAQTYLLPLHKILLDNHRQTSTVERMIKDLEPIWISGSELVTALKPRFGEMKNVGDVLLSFTRDSLPLYESYLIRYSFYEEELERVISRCPLALAFVADVNCSGSGVLQDLLITPVQRLARYSLFIDRLVRETPATHVDFANLRVAQSNATAVVRAINSKVNSFETALKEERLANKEKAYPLNIAFEPPLGINDGRHQALLYQQVFRAVSSVDVERICVALLNSHLIVGLGIPKSDKFKLEHKWKLHLTFVKPDNYSESRLHVVSVGQEDQLIHFPNGKSERDMWMQKFEEAVKNRVSAKASRAVSRGRINLTYSNFDGKWVAAQAFAAQISVEDYAAQAKAFTQAELAKLQTSVAFQKWDRSRLRPRNNPFEVLLNMKDRK